MELLTAFIIGFLGSFHCIGMCGPIVLALPGVKLSSWSFYKGRFLYNIGRVITYSFLGAIFGFLGNRIALFGTQQIVSIVLGIIIILLVITPRKFRSKFLSLPLINYYNSKLKSLFTSFFKKGSSVSLFTIGMLNGFLPCGFVYIGIAGAIAVSSNGILNSVLFMALFGLGTIPAMFGTSLIGNIITLNFKQRLLKLTPVFALILGLIFVFRGLNLGIPYLSPKLQNLQKTQIEEPVCH
jgi:sulfite exporter TauE/SafE